MKKPLASINRKTIGLILVSIIFSQFFHGFAQNVARLAVYDNGQKRAYLEYLPSDYENSNEKVPVIIFLHGSGEKGNHTDTLDVRKIENVSFTCPPLLIKKGHNMTFTVNGKTESFAVFCPQTNSSWAYGDNFDYVAPFVQYLLQTYSNIDPERIYLTGFSLGANGTWETAYSPFNLPQRYAAIAPVSGTGSAERACRLAHEGVGVWAFHGTNDYYTVYMGHRPILGMGCIPNPDTLFTVYQGATHVQVPGYAYRDDHSIHNPNLYEWFLQHTLSPVDTIHDTIPEAPDNLIAESVSNTEIRISWNDNSTNETGFQIERSNTTDSTYVLIHTNNANENAYMDQFLNPNTNYCYRVRAINEYGVTSYTSVNCAITSVEIPDEITLDNSMPGVTLIGTWTTSTAGGAEKYGINYLHDGNTVKGTKEVGFHTDNVSGYYEVFAWWFAFSNRSTNTPFYIEHAGGTSVIFQNQQINGGQWVSLGKYDFTGDATITVKNENTNGYVVADAIRMVKINDIPPAVPGELLATAVSETAVNLFWKDYSTTETGFEIVRSPGISDPYSTIATVPANVTSYTDTGLNPMTTYYYQVRSINAGGKSAYSNADSAYTFVPEMQTYIIDNLSEGVTISGNWTTSYAGGTEKYESNYLHNGNDGNPDKTVSFETDLIPGYYEVFAWWFAYPNRSTRTPFCVLHHNGISYMRVNQQINSGQWVSLGTYTFSTGGKVIIGCDTTDGYVIADAIKFEQISGLKSAPQLQAGNREEIAVNIFPNPVNSTLQIEIPGTERKEAIISITDISGRTEWTKTFNSDNPIAIDIQNTAISSGLKIISIQIPDHIPVTKLVSVMR